MCASLRVSCCFKQNLMFSLYSMKTKENRSYPLGCCKWTYWARTLHSVISLSGSHKNWHKPATIDFWAKPYLRDSLSPGTLLFYLIIIVIQVPYYPVLSFVKCVKGLRKNTFIQHLPQSDTTVKAEFNGKWLDKVCCTCVIWRHILNWYLVPFTSFNNAVSNWDCTASSGGVIDTEMETAWWEVDRGRQCNSILFYANIVH